MQKLLPIIPIRLATPQRHYAIQCQPHPHPHPHPYQRIALISLRTPSLPRSFTRRTTAGLPLHLLMGEAARIVGREGIVTLSVPLLAAEAKLGVLLLALVLRLVAAATTVGSLGRGIQFDVEQIFLFGICQAATRSFCEMLAGCTNVHI
jgi:hypothetical protein